MRIAIAEDYRMMRDLLRTVCTGEFGYEVVAEADTGPRRTKPDLLLLDLHLPGFDGFTVIEKIREQEQERSTRILIVSSYCDDYTPSPGSRRPRSTASSTRTAARWPSCARRSPPWPRTAPTFPPRSRS